MKKYFFIAAIVSTHLNLFAQDSTQTLNEVVVTANKFSNKSSSTGKVVTVITREQIEKSGSRDLSQVINEQAGIYINGANSNAGKDKSIYLRGAKVDYTLIMVDGVPLYDVSGIGSNFDIRLLSIDNVERIEILKGSQSTLYGADAMAGVINIFTRKPAKEGSALSGMLSYGSFNTVKGNAALSGSAEKFDYTLNYSFTKTDGIDETTDTTNSNIAKDKDGFTQHNLYESFSYKPNKHIKLQPYLRFSTFKQAYDQNAFLDELDLTSNNTNVQWGIKNEFELGKLRMNLLYNYNHSNRSFEDDSTKSRNGYDLYNKGKYFGNEHFADAYFYYPINQLFKIVGGADYRSSNSDQSFVSIGQYPYSEVLGKDSLKQNQIGLYAVLTANTSVGFNVDLGGRSNKHSAYGNNFVYNFNPSFLLNKKFKLFANISTAYKTPSLYQLYSEIGNKNLKPTTALTYEGGLQYFSGNNTFNGRITFFDRKVKDAIVTITDPVTYQYQYINQDKQNDYGLDIEASYRLGKATSIKVFYTYVDGKITTVENAKDTSYFNLFRRPKNNLNLQVASAISQSFYCTASLQYVGKRTDIDFGVYPFVEVSMKSYTLFNFYTEYTPKISGISLFADFRNITNTKYTEVYGYNSMGFNASVGLRIKL